jgi:hypothetical protein
MLKDGLEFVARIGHWFGFVLVHDAPLFSVIYIHTIVVDILSLSWVCGLFYLHGRGRVLSCP